MKPAKPPKKEKNQLVTIAKYSGFGMEMAGGIIVPTIIGQKIDKRMGNTEIPVFTLILAAVGLFYVFYRLYQFSSK